jgi:hypothetical protein
MAIKMMRIIIPPSAAANQRVGGGGRNALILITTTLMAILEVGMAQNCLFRGGTCNECLKVPGCEYCQLTGQCYPVAQSNAKCPSALDTRRAKAGGLSIDAVCANKCTSQSCPVENSACQRQTNKCLCKAGFHAEGEAGHATLCVPQIPESKYKEVVSKCVDADQSGKVCTKAYMSNSQFGCASAMGHTLMKDKCQASCGKYCQENGCKGNGADYAIFYCVPSGKGDCKDTNAIDYACPHHQFGKSVPSMCNDPVTDRDDQCATVFTQWYYRCGAEITKGLPAKIKAELVDFAQLCRAALPLQCNLKLNLAIGGTATSPDHISIDVGNSDHNAIDGKHETYWDEADAKTGPYILQVSKPRPIVFAGYTIVPYGDGERQDPNRKINFYSPKSWTVLCDGVTIDTERNIKYQLPPNNPFTKCMGKVFTCSAVQLKITAKYGLSPAIREFQLHPAKANSAGGH